LGYDIELEPEELPETPPPDLFYPEPEEYEKSLERLVMTDIEKYLGGAGEFVVYRQ
jgi:hypothetical protein